MNLQTIKAIRHAINEIARQAAFERQGLEYGAGATDVYQRIDRFLRHLIVENGGEVKEPSVFRYIEVRKIVAMGLYDVVYREKAQDPGSMTVWMRRIKELESQYVSNTDYFVATICDHESEQELIGGQVQEKIQVTREWEDLNCDGYGMTISDADTGL